MAKTRTQQQRSIDPAAQQMLIRADELGLGTAFTRAEEAYHAFVPLEDFSQLDGLLQSPIDAA